jgi:hydrophobe/amphiphile efflux-1 (HAE1) family protein
MTISAPFILRPIATALLFIAVTVLGAIGYYFLPVAPLPTVDFPTIQVTTSFPGASPEVVETSITAPLEHYFGQISDLTSMDSTSSLGTSQITLQFALSRNIDAAAQDVQAAINAASGWIPINLLPAAPIYRLVNPADSPVLILALTSDVLPLYLVNDYAETVLVQKLSQLPGVGQVTVEGGQTRAVRLQINPIKAAGMGLSLEDVRLAVSATTTDTPKGELDGPRQTFEIGANDQLFTADAFNQSVLAYRKGAPVLLRDIGHAVEGAENSELAALYNGVPAILLDIQRQPGANAIEVVNSIRSLLPKLRTSVPPALKIAIVTDRTATIRASIADVQFTLVLTVALVILVIFLFLRKFWATVIPSVVLPVSIIATFAIMAILNFSIDNLSLMALTIASGFVVDDAIVMIENIARYVEAGESPFEAALKGARQIGFTVVSLTISLIAVFIPLLLMQGVVGRLFREFAITLSLAVAVSCIVSLTLTPMMCGHLLRAEAEDARSGAFLRWSERGFDILIRNYTIGLDWVLRHRVITLLFAVATMAMTGWLYVIVPKGFLPEQDTGLLIATTDAPQDISFVEMAARQSRLVDVIRQDPAVVSVASFVGAGIINPTLNTGRLYIDIGKPDRRAAAAVIVQRLYRRAAEVSGIMLHLRPVQDIAIEVRPTRTQYQEVVQALDDQEVRLWTTRLVAELQRMPEFTDAASDQQDEGLQTLITVDRAAAARFGVTMSAVDQTLYDAFGQRQITTVYTPLTQYHVVLEVDPAFRNDAGILNKIYIGGQDSANNIGGNGTGTGAIGADFHQPSPSVPLSSFTHSEQRTAPLAITHQGLFPAITISFNLADTVSLGSAIEALRRAEQRLRLPETIKTSLAGAAAEFVASLQNETLLILAAIVTVYIVLGILYESFVHPITILSTLPSAGVGALLALMVAGEPLDVISLIAIILLIGIVKKNAIMMVDFALAAERERGESPASAIREACILRFRPIMMTTMAALLGAIPLAAGSGIGSELRRPLGVALVGGLIFSQTLTLYTTPVIYLAFDSLQQRWRRRRSSIVGDRVQPATETL